jgi:ABC-type transport system involved in multi-copper enzyme maturation permease subunit
MHRILVVAANIFRGLLSKRALYVWAAAVLLMLVRSGPAIFLRDQNRQLAAFFRANAISASLDTWALLAVAAAIFLGAASVSGEKTHRTISTVLARPIRRWEFLVGQWLGVTLFSLCSLAIGVVLAVSLAAYMQIEIDTPRAAMALAQTTGCIALFAAASVALGSNTSVALAASFTVLLAFLPPLVTILRNDAKPWQHYSGVVLDYVTPPGYTSHYLGVTWADMPAEPNRAVPRFQRPTLDYANARMLLAKNVGYGLVYFLIGCVVFSRRDVRLS